MRAEYRKQKAKAKFIDHLFKTWKNKLCAITLIIIAVLGTMVVDDATGMLFMVPIAIPMFFSKKKYFE